MDYDYVKGSGKFIFFLHGWGGDKNSFSIVKESVAHFGRNMVFVSFAGFGKTPPPILPYYVKDYVFELKSLILKLAKGKSVDIVCHSFGGRVASVFAAENPNLVSKILMVDVAGIKPKRSLKYYIKVFRYKRLKKLVKLGKLDESVLKKYGSEDYKNLSGLMRQTFVNVVNEDLANFYKKISCPTLLFWGEKDTETPLYMAKKIKRFVKNSVLITAKDCGHFSYIEDFPLFYKMLSEFIFENK